MCHLQPTFVISAALIDHLMSAALVRRFFCFIRKVEAEAVPEVSAKAEIATVPTFVLLKVCMYGMYILFSLRYIHTKA